MSDPRFSLCYFAWRDGNEVTIPLTSRFLLYVIKIFVGKNDKDVRAVFLQMFFWNNRNMGAWAVSILFQWAIVNQVVDKSGIYMSIVTNS